MRFEFLRLMTSPPPSPMSTDPTAVPAKCLKCEANLASPIVCTGCRTLYPVPPSMDYFDLLGLERRFDLSDAKLMSAYRAMTRRIHPDRFMDQPEEARTLAMRLSAQLNEAVGVLRDPVRRASYLLDLAGGPSASEVRDVPGCLLNTIMILREEIEEARAASDTGALARLRSTLKASRSETLGHIASLSDRLAASDAVGKREFRKLINSVKYYDKLLGELVVDPLSDSSGASNA